jgi:glutamyl-tRNA(Gln) amidotransferase subunit E
MQEKIDYRKIGLKSGIEIHQQLDTKKLFCRCPSLLRKDSPQYKVARNLHAVT